LLILLRKSIARCGLFVALQAHRFALAPVSVAAPLPHARARSFNQTATLDHMSVRHMSARGSLLFSELRGGDAARCYHIASFIRTAAINQTFPGIYCLVRRRFD
jgi:hypothetical protein